MTTGQSALQDVSNIANGAAASSEKAASIVSSGAAAQVADSRPVVCVFCGASPGKSPEHLEAARSLAHALHKADAKVVYGGGTVGIMGEVAKTLVSLSGPSAVHGIIPQPLIKFEQQRSSADSIDASIYGRTTIVPDMHTRKAQMAKEVVAGGKGGGFVALSGGYGTIEEIMEITTWNQLGIHQMPVVLYNVDGYWDGLVQWINKAVDSGFVSEGSKGIVSEAKSADEVIECLQKYELAKGRFDLKWDEQ